MSSDIGLVLSGGGARGAFEVGVLAWIADHRPELIDRVTVLTGASVGAINATYLASHGTTPDAVHRLAAIWRGLELDRVLIFSARRFLRFMVTGRLFGHLTAPIGALDTRPYQALIRDNIDWPNIQRRLDAAEISGLAVAATDIASGRTHVFAQIPTGAAAPQWPSDASMVGWSAVIGPHHVFASTALPYIFAPVRIGDLWYCDGGLRQNTPLSPALRLGASKLLAVSVKSTRPENRIPAGKFPGMGHLLGKLFNSWFLDRMVWDLDRLHRINAILDGVEEIGGAPMVAELQRALVGKGRRAYASVPYVGIQPEGDLGAEAAKVLASPRALRSRLMRWLRVSAEDRTGVADVASYVLFDGLYAEKLIEEGHRAAALHQDDFDVLM